MYNNAIGRYYVIDVVYKNCSNNICLMCINKKKIKKFKTLHLFNKIVVFRPSVFLKMYAHYRNNVKTFLYR